MPELSSIDHIHVYIPDRAQAADWFRQTLGFEVVERLRVWADDAGGPLTISNPSGTIHLALFQRDSFVPSTAIAFGAADAANFLSWRKALETRGILQRMTDHQLAWSLYFDDPYGNSYEITTFEYDEVSSLLKRQSGA